MILRSLLPAREQDNMKLSQIKLMIRLEPTAIYPVVKELVLIAKFKTRHLKYLVRSGNPPNVMNQFEERALSLKSSRLEITYVNEDIIYST